MVGCIGGLGARLRLGSGRSAALGGHGQRFGVGEEAERVDRLRVDLEQVAPRIQDTEQRQIDVVSNQGPHERLIRVQFLAIDGQALLFEEGHEVVLAFDGEDGVKMASGEEPDLIFLDIGLPGINGIEALSKIKKTIRTRPRS